MLAQQCFCIGYPLPNDFECFTTWCFFPSPVSKRHRKSMLLSELCVVSVSVPASIIRTQRGRGSLLKFRFSPYTQIEFLRVAILKVRGSAARSLSLERGGGWKGQAWLSCDILENHVRIVVNRLGGCMPEWEIIAVWTLSKKIVLANSQVWLTCDILD